MENFTPSAAGPLSTSLSLPQDGDNNGGPPKVADVRPGVEGVANDLKFVLAGVRGATIAGSIVAMDPATGLSAFLIGYPLTPGQVLRLPLLELQHGATLTAVALRVNPADDALPTTNVSMSLRRKATQSSAAEETIWTVTDPAVGAGYQAAHTFIADPADHVIDRQYAYYLAIIGELGGDTDNVSIDCPPLYAFTVAGINLVSMGSPT